MEPSVRSIIRSEQPSGTGHTNKPDKIRHIHHDAYKVLAVLIPDSVQQLPALFKFRLQFMDLFAKQIHGITISFIQALKLIIP